MLLKIKGNGKKMAKKVCPICGLEFEPDIRNDVSLFRHSKNGKLEQLIVERDCYNSWKEESNSKACYVQNKNKNLGNPQQKGLSTLF